MCTDTDRSVTCREPPRSDPSAFKVDGSRFAHAGLDVETCATKLGRSGTRWDEQNSFA